MKQTYELIAPCHFGLEAVLKKEILDLGYEISQVEDGRVTFIGDDEAICRANVFLRTAERILLKAGSFRAETFEELFQGTKAIAWEEFIPEDGKFWVAKASSIKSKLFSPFRYPVHYEKGHGRADERALPCILVSRGRGKIPAACVLI